ncbi:MAG: hypothetical protein KC592_05510 [Nitrospira sp.]|nr:hypothetical protein [Nitrospira sp.]
MNHIAKVFQVISLIGIVILNLTLIGCSSFGEGETYSSTVNPQTRSIYQGRQPITRDGEHITLDSILNKHNNETVFQTQRSVWQEKHSRFLQEAEALSMEVELLTSHPGWPSILQIIKSYSSLSYVEGPEAAQRKFTEMISNWNAHWNAEGEKFYQKYYALTRRSQDLEIQRMKLWNENDGMYKKYWKEKRDELSSMTVDLMANDLDTGAVAAMAYQAGSQSYEKMEKGQMERDSVLRQVYWLNPEDGLLRRKLSMGEINKLFSP